MENKSDLYLQLLDTLDIQFPSREPEFTGALIQATSRVIVGDHDYSNRLFSSQNGG